MFLGGKHVGGEHSLGEYTGMERSGGYFPGGNLPRTETDSQKKDWRPPLIIHSKFLTFSSSIEEVVSWVTSAFTHHQPTLPPSHAPNQPPPPSSIYSQYFLHMWQQNLQLSFIQNFQILFQLIKKFKLNGSSLYSLHSPPLHLLVSQSLSSGKHTIIIHTKFPISKLYYWISWKLIEGRAPLPPPLIHEVIIFLFFNVLGNIQAYHSNQISYSQFNYWRSRKLGTPRRRNKQVYIFFTNVFFHEMFNVMNAIHWSKCYWHIFLRVKK